MATTGLKRFWDGVRTPVWVSRIVFFVGLANLLSAYFPIEVGHRVRWIEQMVPDAFPAAATTGSAALGLLLMVLSRAIRRGKFRAWLVVTISTVLTIALHFFRGVRGTPELLCILLLILLLAARPNFQARPDRRSVRRFLTVVVLGPIVATGMGWLWLQVFDGQQAHGTTSWERLQHAFVGLAGFTGPVNYVASNRHPASYYADHAAVALVVLGAAVLIAAILTAMEPADGPTFMSADDSERVRAMLDKYGSNDSLGYFATRDDRHVIFSPSGQSAISYRVVGAVSFAAGDPLGVPADWPEAINAWLAEAKTYGWTPANLGASERGAAAFHKAGLDVLELGDEAILHTDDFSLEGRSMRGVRQAVARVNRAGITAECHRLADLTPEQRRALRQKAVEWREGPVERGFSMALGRFGQMRDSQSVVVVATQTTENSQEQVGLLSLAPWGKDGASLDLMRRTRGAAGFGTENGIVELMVTQLMADAPTLGIKHVSLNFAVFRSAFERGERLGAGPSTRLWRGVLMQASKFAQIESLYRSNAKYQPEWLPRFIVYPSVSDIPKIATAALRAEAFLVAPNWYLRLTGQAPSDIDTIERD
ncbi:membrane protein [Nocardioides baekrokdamisoli]|uniref:Membrane protein n=1 Tax=Nocardioides baekrokdamisoli TaxID=1804624 RepID=A0A3G9IUL9_9ACTN|nr:phosphatidylglycerol lysyltransferase domain-containing protein [Nocardioides baekrokdamisoli]BBH17341.1 membrane protein [Nocardioides baekrokdamisoli]